PADRFLRVVEDRRAVARAEHVEVHLEQLPCALPRLRGVVQVLVGHEAERLARRVDEEVCREERVRRLCSQERVLGRSRAGGEDRLEAARKQVPLLVPDVRFLVDLAYERRRVDLDAELSAQPPGRALVAAAREADRADPAKGAEGRVLEGQGVDQDDAVPVLHRMRRRDEAADPLVVDPPVPEAGNDLLRRRGDGLRLAHRAVRYTPSASTTTPVSSSSASSAASGPASSRSARPSSSAPAGSSSRTRAASGEASAPGGGSSPNDSSTSAEPVHAVAPRRSRAF